MALVVTSALASACSVGNHEADHDPVVAPTGPSATSDAGPDATGGPDADAGPALVEADELAAVMDEIEADLSADPVAAARELVAVVRAGTDREAIAATAAIARRSGLAIVSIGGGVVALPDDAAFSDIPLPAEMVEHVTRSVRSGALYSVESVGSLLHRLDTVDGPMQWPQLAVTVSEWGKDPEAPAFIRSAATAVRALSGERGQVFAPVVPAAEQGLDALQLLLVVAHAGGVPVPVPTDDGHGSVGPAGIRAIPRAATGPCDGIQQALSPADPTATEALTIALGKWSWGKVVDHAVTFHGELAELPGVDSADLGMVKNVQRLTKAYDLTNKAASYLAILVLLLGTELDLSTDQPVTHYKHSDGSTVEEVTATARVTFDSALAQQQLACYGLAGLQVPRNGPIAGMNIRWSLGQDLRPSASGDLAASAHLRPVAASVPKFTLDKTDANGNASVVLKPPVEDEPGTGRELRASVVLTAHVEKGEFPFSLSDLTAVLDLNVQSAVIGKTIDALKSISVDELLPTAKLTLGVRYHGAEVAVAKVENSVNLVLYEIPRVYTDLVSCSGVEGPFTGPGGYSTVGIGQFGQWSSAGLASLGLPALPNTSPAQDNPLSVMPTANGQPTTFLIAQGDGAPFVEGVITINEQAASTDDAFGWVTFDVGDGRQGQPVGELELLLGGSSWPFSDLTTTVYRIASDPRCPDAGVHWDAN